MVKNCDAKKNLKVFIEEQYVDGKKGKRNIETLFILKKHLIKHKIIL